MTAACARLSWEKRCASGATRCEAELLHRTELLQPEDRTAFEEPEVEVTIAMGFLPLTVPHQPSLSFVRYDFKPSGFCRAPAATK